MPQPVSGTTVSRPDLAQLVMEFRETAVTGGIADRVMPMFPVAQQAMEFPVIPKEVMLKIPATQRALRQSYGRSDWEFELVFLFHQGKWVGGSHRRSRAETLRQPF
jgi:hypothetical protein